MFTYCWFEERIHDFLAQFSKTLAEMSEDKFNSHKAALISSTLQKSNRHHALSLHCLLTAWGAA